MSYLTLRYKPTKDARPTSPVTLCAWSITRCRQCHGANEETRLEIAERYPECEVKLVKGECPNHIVSRAPMWKKAPYKPRLVDIVRYSHW